MATWTPKYLERLKASRGPREVGEYFVFKWRDRGYFWGRVIRDRCATSPSPDAPLTGPWRVSDGIYLVYVYAVTTDATEPIPPLDRRRLRIAPLLVSNFPWTSGYFRTVHRAALVKGDVLARHCFASGGSELTSPTLWYADEMGNRLSGPSNPRRLRALSNHGSIETEIALLLGLEPRVD